MLIRSKIISIHYTYFLNFNLHTMIAYSDWLKFTRIGGEMHFVPLFSVLLNCTFENCDKGRFVHLRKSWSSAISTLTKRLLVFPNSLEFFNQLCFPNWIKAVLCSKVSHIPKFPFRFVLPRHFFITLLYATGPPFFQIISFFHSSVSKWKHDYISVCCQCW